MNEMNCDVIRLLRACQELALQNVLLEQRVLDLETEIESTRKMAFNACHEVVKIKNEKATEKAVSPSP